MHVRLIGLPSDLQVPLGTSVLGRGGDCSLHVDDPRLSRHHARFHFDGDSLAVEDAGSTNGVLVNGDRIAGLTGLKNGDDLVCGPCRFSISMDETIRSSPSELLPQPETVPGRSTETMEPIEGGPDYSAGRRLNPIIAAAVSNGSETGSSNRLHPHEISECTTSALAARRVRKTVVSGSDAIEPNSAASPESPEAQPSPAPRKDRTTGLVPADYKQDDQIALQAEYTDKSSNSRPAIWRRGLAGLLDSLQTAVVMTIVSAPLLLLGYVMGLKRAGAIMDGGLPHLVDHPLQPAHPVEIATSLLSLSGIDRASALVAQLYHRDDQQAFLSFFSCSTAAVLAAMLVVVLGLVSSTVLHGGPFWHRFLGIEIVEHQTGYFPTWMRSLARWLLFALLIVASPIGLLLSRGLHDRFSGCRVRSRRR